MEKIKLKEILLAQRETFLAKKIIERDIEMYKYL